MCGKIVHERERRNGRDRKRRINRVSVREREREN